MKNLINKILVLVCLVVPAASSALDPGDVRLYDDVFEISARVENAGRIEIDWNIADDYYLYNNRFLRFTSDTPGVIFGEPDIPPGEKKFDALLGEEVIKFHDRLTIGLPVVSGPAAGQSIEVVVRSQGCLEAVLCYPPTEQRVIVQLPPGQGSVSPVSPLDQMMSGSLTGVGVEPAMGEPALQPDEAFVYEAIGLSKETMLARFTAQPGYYLYVDKFAFKVIEPEGFEVREVSLPAGTIKDDPEFGKVPVIYDQVEIPIRVNRPAGPQQNIVLQAEYQGCRDGDICYPPQISTVSLVMAEASEAISAKVVATADSADRRAVKPPQSEQSKLASMLVENPLLALVSFFLAGILLAFTPCVFPMVPILSGIIAGEGDRITTGRAFWLSLIYVLAMAVTYTVAGVLAGLFGQNLQAMFQNPWVISTFVVIFVLLAFSMFGFYELQLPSRWQTAMTEQSNRQSGGKLGGVAIMGFLSALIVGPCVAPPLAAALIVIGNSGSPVLGGTALFALSMGMGVPLMVFGMTAGKYLPRAGAWMNAIKAVFGVGLLALAIYMLERILPPGIIMVLWGVLMITCGVYLGALQAAPQGSSGWKQLWRALGLVLLVLGVMQMVGAASGGNNWLQPLKHLRGSGQAQQEKVTFTKIKAISDLEAAVAVANQSGKPAMFDFYADWCVECIRMERNTFPDSTVQALLKKIQPIKADVTQNDEVDQALMQQFDVIGPPAILFFDSRGQEMKDYRLVGYFKPEEFSAHLQLVLEAQ